MMIVDKIFYKNFCDKYSLCIAIFYQPNQNLEQSNFFFQNESICILNAINLDENYFLLFFVVKKIFNNSIELHNNSHYFNNQSRINLEKNIDIDNKGSLNQIIQSLSLLTKEKDNLYSLIRDVEKNICDIFTNKQKIKNETSNNNAFQHEIDKIEDSLFPKIENISKIYNQSIQVFYDFDKQVVSENNFLEENNSNLTDDQKLELVKKNSNLLTSKNTNFNICAQILNEDLCFISKKNRKKFLEFIGKIEFQFEEYEIYKSKIIASIQIRDPLRENIISGIQSLDEMWLGVKRIKKLKELEGVNLNDDQKQSLVKEKTQNPGFDMNLNNFMRIFPSYKDESKDKPKQNSQQRGFKEKNNDLKSNKDPTANSLIQKKPLDKLTSIFIKNFLYPVCISVSLTALFATLFFLKKKFDINLDKNYLFYSITCCILVSLLFARGIGKCINFEKTKCDQDSFLSKTFEFVSFKKIGLKIMELF